MQRVLRLTVVVFSALAFGCDSAATAPPIPDLTGTWNGMAVDAEWTLTLVEDGSEVSGNGRISVGSESISISADGVHPHPEFSITLSSSGVQDMNYSGVVSESGNRLSGNINGSGFNGDALIMTRVSP